MTPVDKIAEELGKEAKRLCPPAFVKPTSTGNDREANLYIYAPRKFADMLQTRLQAKRAQLLKAQPGANMNIRILMEDMEKMSPELKAQYEKEQAGGAA